MSAGSKELGSSGAATGRCSLSGLDLDHERLLAEARVLFAAAALLLNLVHETGAARAGITLVLLAYAAYGGIRLWWLSHGSQASDAAFAHWIDAFGYTLAVVSSGGFASPFVIFLLFPILVASVQRGFLRGVVVLLGCAAMLLGWGAAEGWAAGDVEGGLSAGPAAVVLVAGIAVAKWGHSEATQVRRLALLTDLNGLVSPAHGVHYAVFQMAEMLRAYHHADACIVVLRDPAATGCLLYEVNEATADRPLRGRRIANNMAGLFQTDRDELLLYRRRPWPGSGMRGGAYDLKTRARRCAPPERLAECANVIEADSFVSLPVLSRNRPIGRFYLASRRSNYLCANARFMGQLATQVGLLIDNMQLMEQVYAEAAHAERRKISLDLHDGTIQPYIGLKLALEALRRKLPAGDPAVADVEDLISKAGDGIGELREYIGILREQQKMSASEPLLPAVRSQAKKFAGFYGIDVQVVADNSLTASGALASEVRHIVHEALSNIRRHTAAECALINMRHADGRLVLEFVNDKAVGSPGGRRFVPHSINERARELGGRVNVEHRAGGHTAVLVELPA